MSSPASSSSSGNQGQSQTQVQQHYNTNFALYSREWSAIKWMKYLIDRLIKPTKILSAKCTVIMNNSESVSQAEIDKMKKDVHDELRAIKVTWLRLFEYCNTAKAVVGKDDASQYIQVVPSDQVCFAIWRILTVTHGMYNTDPIKRSIKKAEIYDIYVTMVILSCRHSEDSIESWPSKSDWSNFCMLVAAYHCNFVQFGDKGDLTAALKKVKPFKIDKKNRFSHRLYEERRMPATFAIEMQKMIDTHIAENINRLTARGVDIPSDVSKLYKPEDLENADEVKGDMWKCDPEFLVDNLWRMCSRLIYVVEYHNRFLREYRDNPVRHIPRYFMSKDPNGPKELIEIKPIHVRYTFPLQFKDELYDNLVKFVRNNCSDVMVTYETRNRFKEIVNMLMMPLGSSTNKIRSIETKDSPMSQYEVLQTELGASLTSHYSTMMDLTPLIEFADPSHYFFFPLLLTLIELIVSSNVTVGYNDNWVNRPRSHNSKVRFIDDYFFIHPESNDSQIKMFEPHLYGNSVRCPVFLPVGGQWGMYYDNRFLDCANSSNTILSWMETIMLDCGGKTDNGCDWSKFIKENFIPDPKNAFKVKSLNPYVPPVESNRN